MRVPCLGLVLVALGTTWLYPYAAAQAAKAVPQTTALAGKARHGTGKQPSLADTEQKAPEKNVYAYGLPAEDGKNLPLSTFKGKVLLIVNLGRMSTYASQLGALETLSNTFKDKGLVVLGVPSNDFGNAEPGTPAEVARAYAGQKVNFPVMQLSALTGVHALPLFDYLAKNKAIKDDGLHWNYTKFLVDRQGHVIVRFGPEVAPDSLQMIATVQEVVDGTWKPKKAEAKKDDEGGGDDDDDVP